MVKIPNITVHRSREVELSVHKLLPLALGPPTHNIPGTLPLYCHVLCLPRRSRLALPSGPGSLSFGRSATPGRQCSGLH